MSKGIIWTDEEKALLVEHYPLGGKSGAGKHLPGRSAVAIYEMAKFLHIKRVCTSWSPDEIECLKKYYPVGGTNEVLKYLPHRTSAAIRNNASDIGLVAPRLNRWSIEELDAVRKYWPIGGYSAAGKHLPKRTIKAVRRMAIELGVKAPVPAACREDFANYYPPDPNTDRIITEAYKAGKGANEIAKLTGRKPGWIKYRAVNLGVRMARTPVKRWEEKELEIVYENAGKSLQVIQRKLDYQGFKRTELAIRHALNRYQIDNTPDDYTAADFARLMGVSATAVTNWITKGWLKARKYQRMNPEPLEPHRHWIKPSDAREFIISSVAHINIGKCDKYWLVDLLDAKYSGRALKSTERNAA